MPDEIAKVGNATLASAIVVTAPTDAVAARPVIETLQSGCITGVPSEAVAATPVSETDTEVAPK